MPSLVEKLQLKPNQQILAINVPEVLLANLTPLPNHSQISHATDQLHDVVLLFATTVAELQTGFATVQKTLSPEGVLWTCYPKKTSKLSTDLNRDEGWDVITNAGWKAVRVVALDNDWSGVRWRAYISRPLDPFAAQYAGTKSTLLPLFHQLIQIAHTFGDDIQQSTRQTYVALSRKKQFATIHPATPLRLDVGLKLPNTPHNDRLQPAGSTSSGSMTHKIALTKLEEIDEQFTIYFHQAYHNGGEQ